MNNRINLDDFLIYFKLLFYLPNFKILLSRLPNLLFHFIFIYEGEKVPNLWYVISNSKLCPWQFGLIVFGAHMSILIIVKVC